MTPPLTATSLKGCSITLPADPQVDAVDLRLRADRRRVVIFDDDPTGTQTVSDVDVLLRLTDDRLDAFFRSQATVIYVLTNTRAVDQETAIARLRTATEQVDRAAVRCGVTWTPMLRGDSTLRGHVFAESDALATERSITLLVPAFPEGGRTTADGQQWVLIDGHLTNAADTEFARDATFGYRSRNLVDWVAEVGGGRRARVISLETLRLGGPAVVTNALEDAVPGSVVIPEAETKGDLRSIAVGLLDAEAAGRHVVVRSAASFVAVRCNLKARDVPDVTLPRDGRILVACGSHTSASTAQLEELVASGVPLETLATDDNGLAERLSAHLAVRGVAAVATPRHRTDGGDLGSGARMMARLQELVGALAQDVDAVLAKGGITSAEIATALGCDIARVDGQIEPGVALWTLRLSGQRTLPFVVVPGNVGDRRTLVSVLVRLGWSAPSSGGGN